jgi:hypothetical protein
VRPYVPASSSITNSSSVRPYRPNTNVSTSRPGTVTAPARPRPSASDLAPRYYRYNAFTLPNDAGATAGLCSSSTWTRSIKFAFGLANGVHDPPEYTHLPVRAGPVSKHNVSQSG